MPVSDPPSRAHPSKPFHTWADAARARQIVTMRCNVCRQSCHYLPEDLAHVFGSDQPAHVPPFSCSRCRTAEYIRVTVKVLRPEEALTLTVRRPIKPVQRWIWRTVPLSG